MKLMYVVLLALVIALPAITFAQGEPGFNKMSLGVNAEVSVPVGDFSTIAGIGYGGNVRYQYGGDLRGVLTLTAGYLVWGKKDLGANTSVQPKAFSVFIGGKYYFVGGFFGTVEGGAYFMSYTYEGNVIGAEGNTGRFMLPIGLGFQKSGFEIGARYLLLATDFNAFSFTLGYNFML
jgi:hypothetical protein